MPRPSRWSRLVSSLRATVAGVADSISGIFAATPPAYEPRHARPVSEPTPVPPKRPKTYEELDPKRQRVVDRILAWFPEDGHYVKTGAKWMYQSSQGISWHPGNPFAVEFRIEDFSEAELDLVLSISREEYRHMASNNPKFWYH